MDTSALNISFNQDGHCNFCSDFLAGKNKKRIIPAFERQVRLEALCKSIKATRGKKYDCVIGVSGGVDSTYAVHLAKEQGLNPLAVHLDNGWNSELATSNIHTILKKLNVDLYTHVIDWEEFRDLQRSFISADVVDIEVLTDHAILACLHLVASNNGVSYILTGMNNSTEGMSMPKGWNHFKFDYKNIVSIHKRFGHFKVLKTFPLMSLYKYSYYRYIKKIFTIDFLDYFEYNKEQATELISKKYQFKNYANKHFENIFTRFNQAYLLPKKFKVDKRRLHLSNLICTGQITRESALESIEKSSYSTTQEEREDLEYVIKKLGYSQPTFSEYLQRQGKPHSTYPSDYPLYRRLRKLAYNY
jgi:N-acetyl sugar amidotransferase